MGKTKNQNSRDGTSEQSRFRYTARMKYTADAIKRLCIVRRNTFEFGKKVIMAVCAIAMIVIGLLMSGSNGTAIVLMPVGCIALTGLNAKARGLADQIIKSYDGKEYPHLQYFF